QTPRTAPGPRHGWLWSPFESNRVGNRRALATASERLRQRAAFFRRSRLLRQPPARRESLEAATPHQGDATDEVVGAQRFGNERGSGALPPRVGHGPPGHCADALR